MSNELFFKDPLLPFAECRYSQNSGRHYKSHLHKQFSIGAIDRGKVCYEVDGNTAILQPGSLALINSEILHSCNPVGDCTRSYYMLYLDVAWCFKVQQSIWQADSLQPFKTLLLENTVLYQQYISVMTRLMADGDVLAKEQALVDLLIEVFRLCCRQGKPVRLLCGQVCELKEILGRNLAVSISLNQVAQGLQVNPYTLLRQFKKETGVTPHAYRLNCRVELAKKLLRQGADPAETALECGFFDQSHLHRHFKAITAVTPGEYQRNFVQ